MSAAMYDFPTYRSHKVVRAAQILNVALGPDGAALLDIADHLPVTVEPKVTARYKPVPGDYLVQYEDRYLSISPKKAFEDGYRPVSGHVNLARHFDFGLAICSLKTGKRVARAGWNGKGMWLQFIPAERWGAWTEPCASTLPGGDPSASHSHTPHRLLPFIAMKTADGGLVPWLASQTDVLADDWMLVP